MTRLLAAAELYRAVSGLARAEGAALQGIQSLVTKDTRDVRMLG